MKNEERAELADRLQKGIDEYWLSIKPNDIIRLRIRAITTPYIQREAEEFTAIRLASRGARGFESTMRFIPLNEDRITFRSLPLDWIESINDKPFTIQTEWQVKGSKGNTYTVKLVGAQYQCTCPGYKFRHKCKHSKQIKDENEN